MESGPPRAKSAFLSLGSNQGSRFKQIKNALRALRFLTRTRLLRTSSFYETSPVGTKGQRPYLNACAEIRTALSPMGLLIELKRLEVLSGRRSSAVRWAPRTLDIDILFYGRLRWAGPHLTIPHPRALKRKFVLSPLAEIA
ncbi:MAG: 2-amino-4-hydroxy-6-hydroxymethyldihydropteridine diphosphokinase, partial [Elusimicrobia bacterium]|nr:2-amino-4-hydroxy-6-hydroxymethyldihydropteridine diphosphokinase [Elusimicrobiota bacterium]